MLGPTEEQPTPRPTRVRGTRLLQTTLSLTLVVAVFVFVLPQVADVSDVRSEIAAMSGLEVTLLVVVALWNLATYAFVWMAGLPGLSMAQGTVAAEASTAVANTVPGGSYLAVGLTYSMLHSWGFRRSMVTLALLVTGLWNNFAKLALPVLALALLAITGDADAGRVTAGLLGIIGLIGVVVVFSLALRSEVAAARFGILAQRMASRVLHLLHKPPATGWDIAVTRFRTRTIGLVRARWHILTLVTLISHLSLFLVLLVAIRAVGVPAADVGWIEALAAFAFTRLVTAIPLTPGGLGVVELALTGALVGAGGDRSQVVAAVLVYRSLTFLPPIPIGVGCYLFWRRNRSWRRTPVASDEAGSVVQPA